MGIDLNRFGNSIIEMSYPELAHLGFKTLCAGFMYYNLKYMDLLYHQRQTQLELLQKINNNVRLQNISKAP